MVTHTATDRRAASCAGVNFQPRAASLQNSWLFQHPARLFHVRLFSQVGPVVLFVAALYYRFARHDALRFYVFFGAAAIIACFYLFRYGND